MPGIGRDARGREGGAVRGTLLYRNGKKSHNIPLETGKEFRRYTCHGREICGRVEIRDYNSPAESEGIIRAEMCGYGAVADAGPRSKCDCDLRDRRWESINQS
ncbi:hypothetical protein GWI33_007718 [Rhynchophorus ferrugineus]|uniref:Uncharacterized protein n=1 Tax=Rhynchophorus ferrugineus TaxID=354439 RepID=A0A834MBV8_RHYFE|nr:hypothetical protein GWI33_007718 [Rhynchophorus ferrugineus]